MALGAEGAGAAGHVVEKVGKSGVERVTWKNGSPRRAGRAFGVAGGWRRGGNTGKGKTETVAVQEQCFCVGEGSGSGDVVEGEESV